MSDFIKGFMVALCIWLLMFIAYHIGLEEAQKACRFKESAGYVHG